jgi:GxxExxY protein
MPKPTSLPQRRKGAEVTQSKTLMLSEDELNRVSGTVIGCAIEVHRVLGPGLLESAYQQCLVWELRHAGLDCSEQVAVPLRYKDLNIPNAYRLDILVENAVVLELKAVERIEPIHMAQMLTYLKTNNLKLGLLLNFNVDIMRKGIKRVVNNL